MTLPRLRLPSFTVQVFLGMAAGLLLGFWARDLGEASAAAEALRIVGESFIQLLRALVAAARLHRHRRLDRGAARSRQRRAPRRQHARLVRDHRADRGHDRPRLSAPSCSPARARRSTPPPPSAPATTGSWLDFLRGLVPANILGLGASTKIADGAATTSLSFNVLQIIVVAIAVGVAAVRVGEAGEPFLAFNASALAIFRRILRWVIRLTPIGTAGAARPRRRRIWLAVAVRARRVRRRGLSRARARPARRLSAAAARSTACRPARFFAAAWPAIQLGFVSRSSIGDAPRDRGGRPSGARRAARLCRLRRPARRDHQDGRLRRHLSGDRRDLRRAILRRAAARVATMS